MLKNNVFINKQLTNEAHLNSFLDFINLSVGCDCHNKFKKKNQHQESDFFHYLKDSEKFDTNRFNDWIQKKLANNLIIAFDSFLKNNLDLKTLFEILFGEEDKKDLNEILDQGYRGSRYSFGYPACPDLSQQLQLCELLEPERIGVNLSEEFQLHPEQSTSAIIVHHPEAKYFNAN